MTALTTKTGGTTLVVVVQTPDGKWVCCGRNPREKDIPEGERYDLYERRGYRMELPKGAIKMAISLKKSKIRANQH